ncbi:MAG: hypothetical protein ACE5EG_05275, partial [Thermoanaerobaculia bacterium]
MSLFVSRSVRQRLGEAAAGEGKLTVPSLRAARELAAALGPDEGAAELNALHLLEEAIRRVVRAAAGDELMRRITRAVEEELGRAGLLRLLSVFGREFGLTGEVVVAPTQSAARSEPVASGVGADETGPDAAPIDEPASAGGAAVTSTEAPEATEPAVDLVRDLLVFWWLRTNPALGRLNGLLDTSELTDSTEFQAAGSGFRQALDEAPGLEAGDRSLLASLEAPQRLATESPVAQLRWILPRWRAAVGEIEHQLIAGLDLAAEEHAPRFPPGPGPVEPPVWPGGGLEGAGWPAVSPEARYTDDRDWMPRLSLIAKNALVWLEQLSREHRRPIHRLDEIPDEVLSTLAGRGFSGLWLIGVWERSGASQRIKRMCGNPEAEASA